MKKGIDCFKEYLGLQRYYAFGGNGLNTLVDVKSTKDDMDFVTVELLFREEDSIFIRMKQADFNKLTCVYFHDQFDVTISFKDEKALYFPYLWYGETYDCNFGGN